jgi:hypothetical protein
MDGNTSWTCVLDTHANSTGERVAEAHHVVHVVLTSAVTHVICVPTPGKARLHHTVAVFHTSPLTVATAAGGTSPLLFGFEDAKGSPELRVSSSSSSVSCVKGRTVDSIGKNDDDKRGKVLGLLSGAFGSRWSEVLVVPCDKVFKSCGDAAASDRKRGAMFHVDAHLKAKEG